MDASDPTGLPNPSQKVVALPQRRVVATSEADAAGPAPLRELTVDDVPLLAFARDRDDVVEVTDGVPLGLRVGIAARPVVWFESPPLPIETTADELRGKWGAAPFVVYLYELSDRNRLSRAIKQWQVTLEPESDRDIGHEPWVFSQATPVPPAVARLHKDREALRERFGSTTPDPYEAWGLGADTGAPTSPYDRVDPARDRYGRDAGPDPRGYDDPRHARDEGDARSYDERAPRARRELAEREPDAPPASVYLPPGKQWARTTEGQWLQIDAPGALAAPRRSKLDALVDRFADDPAATIQSLTAAAAAVKAVFDTFAPRREPVEDVIARQVDRALAPIAEKIAVAPTRPAAELIAEERARWDREHREQQLAAQMQAMQHQLGSMRAEVQAARAAPPPPPPKTLAEQVEQLRQTYEALPFARQSADGDAKPATLLGAATEFVGTVLNSEVGNKVAEALAPMIEESAALKRAQRMTLEKNLQPQHPAPHEFAPPPQQFAQQQFAQQQNEQQQNEQWAREQLAARQQELAVQRAQQMAEQTIVEPRQGHTHAFTHAAHAAPAIAHPAPSPTPEADDDAGEEHSP